MMRSWAEHFKCQIRKWYYYIDINSTHGKRKLSHRIVSCIYMRSVYLLLQHRACIHRIKTIWFIARFGRRPTHINLWFNWSKTLLCEQSQCEPKASYARQPNRPTLTIRKLQFSDWPHSSLFIIRTYIYTYSLRQ